MNELRLFREFIEGAERTQVGPLSENLSENEAQLIAQLALSVDGLAKPVATLATQCSAGVADDVIRATNSTGIKVQWIKHDCRSLPVRILGMGSVALTCTTDSAQILSAVLRSTWAYGRVMVCVGDHGVVVGDLGWMQDCVDPSPVFPDHSSSVLVSFFHGKWISLYRPLNAAGDTVERATHVIRGLGRDARLAGEPF